MLIRKELTDLLWIILGLELLSMKMMLGYIKVSTKAKISHLSFLNILFFSPICKFPPICASFLLVQAVVHCGPLFMVIWWFHSPALRQCRPVLFLWLVQHMVWPSNRSKAPPKRSLFTIPPLSQDCSFPLGLGWERLWVGIVKGCYINFDWLIEILARVSFKLLNKRFSISWSLSSCKEIFYFC